MLRCPSTVTSPWSTSMMLLAGKLSLYEHRKREHSSRCISCIHGFPVLIGIQYGSGASVMRTLLVPFGFCTSTRHPRQPRIQRVALWGFLASVESVAVEVNCPVPCMSIQRAETDRTSIRFNLRERPSILPRNQRNALRQHDALVDIFKDLSEWILLPVNWRDCQIQRGDKDKRRSGSGSVKATKSRMPAAEKPWGACSHGMAPRKAQEMNCVKFRVAHH